MATVTVDSLHAEKEPRHGFLARAYERWTRTQMHRARAIAKPYLLDMTDADLKEIGYTRDEISHWPTGPRWL